MQTEPTTATNAQAREYHSLPEPDTSLPDNDLGGMVNVILLASLALGALMWWLGA